MISSPSQYLGIDIHCKIQNVSNKMWWCKKEKKKKKEKFTIIDSD